MIHNKNIKIQVMSRKEFERYAQESHRETSMVISITSYNEDYVQIPEVCYTNAKILSILPVKVNDTDREEQGGMTRDSAKQIANFLIKSCIPYNKLIIHCGAGQSRSAGVAAAILKYYTGSDKQIFTNRKYTPNMLCYRRVLEALMEYQVRDINDIMYTQMY